MKFQICIESSWQKRFGHVSRTDFFWEDSDQRDQSWVFAIHLKRKAWRLTDLDHPPLQLWTSKKWWEVSIVFFGFRELAESFPGFHLFWFGSHAHGILEHHLLNQPRRGPNRHAWVEIDSGKVEMGFLDLPQDACEINDTLWQTKIAMEYHHFQ